MNKLLFALVAFSLCPGAFASENEAAQKAYCKYITEQALAQRDLLRSPSVALGPVRPSTGTPPQMVFGLTNSVADDRKAVLTMRAARTNCQFYTATTEAQQHIYFALPKIERDVVVHRLTLIEQATAKIDKLVAEGDKVVQAQNMTKPALYYLQSARVRLDASRTAALTGITSPYIPPMTDVPLRVLIGDKLQTEEANQKATTKLQKESGWDIQLTGGGHRQLGQFSSPTASRLGAFGEFSLTYDLGRTAANRHYDNSVSAYMEWTASQLDGVTRQAAILKQQVQETITFQKQQLKTLLDHDGDIKKSLESLEGLDTPTALTFSNELTADQIVLSVEIQDMQFRVELLESYLRDNF